MPIAGWYHAEALELDESKISCLVGYKCCKCRRIKNPQCPYNPEKKEKQTEGKKRSRKAPKLDFSEMDSNSMPAALPTKAEFIHVQEDDSLSPSLPKAEQCTVTKLRVKYGSNNSSNVSNTGPRKLPVRRHIKQETDFYSPNQPECFQVGISDSAPSETNISNSTDKLPVRRHVKRENSSASHPTITSFQIEVSNPSEANALISSEAQWDVSRGSFDDGITLDYDSLGLDDMEFEPQTYFSFNELLASDNGGNNTNGNENWGNSSELPDNGALEISYDEEEPIISVGTPIEIVACNVCFGNEPCPDLSCQVCGMWVHSHCSPWRESEGWRCGNCREWR